MGCASSFGLLWAGLAGLAGAAAGWLSGSLNLGWVVGGGRGLPRKVPQG